MLVHLGEDTVVSSSEIIGIFDMAVTDDETTRSFLRGSGAAGRVKDLSGGAAKSMVLTEKGIYLSPISPGTLNRKIQRGP